MPAALIKAAGEPGAASGPVAGVVLAGAWSAGTGLTRPRRRTAGMDVEMTPCMTLEDLWI